MSNMQPFRLSHRAAAYFPRVIGAVIGMLALSDSGLVSATERKQCSDVRAVFERVYVPAYSQVWTHEGQRQPLATTMAVHNIDPEKKIEIVRVDYFDHAGEKVKSLLDEPITLGPFGSQSFLIPIREQVGGFGANYLVEWAADEPAIPPAVEAVMIGGSGTRGLSFTSTGIVIERRP